MYSLRATLLMVTLEMHAGLYDECEKEFSHQSHKREIRASHFDFTSLDVNKKALNDESLLMRL